ncbi:phosducin-like protein [Haliotis rubra]|uniref:phosducin-like protein n=1 Tax=Haliotis rubra TaxID=36100 RepID=UPI001EE54DDD|nr:phosducin-like protein [Haliotis rubra]XP_046574112.1 phosducin-like protein [Haliotis rubra]
MALSMDDKLLGEKTHYYCSSSEGEEESDSEHSQGETGISKQDQAPADINSYQGTCINTGPKGVIRDWREFKQLETEKKEGQEAKKRMLEKKLSKTCHSYLNDESEKTKDEMFFEELTELEDEFLQQYRKRRMEEMKKMLENRPVFGKVLSLSEGDLLTAIDNEKSQVTVIIHIYEENSQACEAMNGCLMCLAQEYPRVKFCKIQASAATLSGNFAANGVPALLIYRNQELIGNYIRLSDEFGEDFFASDIECFLQEHGVLPAEELLPGVRDKVTGELRIPLSQDEDSGSDFEID